MIERMRNAMVSEDGSLNLELAMIVALMVIVCVAALTFLGTSVNTKLGNSANRVNYVS